MGGVWLLLDGRSLAAGRSLAEGGLLGHASISALPASDAMNGFILAVLKDWLMKDWLLKYC